MSEIQLTEPERNELHEHAKRELDGFGNLRWTPDEGYEHAREAAHRIGAAAKLLDAIQWTLHVTTPGLPRVDPEMVAPHASAARDYMQECLADDEAALPMGLADPAHRGDDQSADQFRILQEAQIASDRASVSILEGLLAKVEPEKVGAA